MYYFNRGDESQAWRLIGVAARSCIEMGLHRRESLLKSFSNEAEYLSAAKLFWVVYALDRRWSFGTGMPFALQDADIDANLPEPVSSRETSAGHSTYFSCQDDSSPYLQQITKYNRIASKVWYYNVSHENGSETKDEDVGLLDYQSLQWYQQIPRSLQFNRADIASESQIPDRGQRRLRLLLYLRANQARVSIYRPVLNSATSILGNLRHARTVVDVAKDTISVLTRINQTTDIYRTQQVCYNYFLVQSLAVIFLAVAHAPAEFARQTRNEFCAALDLVKGFSTKSYISKKLWETIRGLREVGDKIGLLARSSQSATGHEGGVADAHSNAAVAMAGLAGHPMDELAMFNGSLRNHASNLGTSPMNGQQLTNELTTLFELAGNHSNFLASSTGAETLNGFVGDNSEGQPTGEGTSNVFGNEQEFSRIMGELF
jgi:Fungal specific transcription factor domain